MTREDPRASHVVLVVDDSATARQRLTTVLTDNGIESVEAYDGPSGLVAARARRFDLCVVDLNMPGMNGIELIGELRRLTGYATTPIFVLTTETTQEFINAGKAAGATAWLIKPFKIDSLMSGIRMVLGPVANRNRKA